MLDGPQWVHEIKHDSHAFVVRRDGDIVRRYRGVDLTDACRRVASGNSFPSAPERGCQRLGSDATETVLQMRKPDG